MRALAYLVLLLTIVWMLFLAASSTIALVVVPVLEGTDRGIFSSAARTLLGLVVFVAWVVGWQRLTEFWLYRILLRKRQQ